MMLSHRTDQRHARAARQAASVVPATMTDTPISEDEYRVQMMGLRIKEITGPAETKGRPPEAKVRAQKLMSDGRWRTSTDVGHNLSISPNHANVLLKRMEAEGLLKAEFCQEGIKLYKQAAMREVQR